MASTEVSKGTKTPRDRLLEAMENQRESTQPIIMQAILMEIADLMGEQVELTRTTVGKGILYPVGNIAVTSAITQLDEGVYPTMPWKGINIYNDGPGAYFIAVNQDYITNPTPIKTGETFNGDFGRDKVKKILLQSSAPGTTANLRVYAII